MEVFVQQEISVSLEKKKYPILRCNMNLVCPWLNLAEMAWVYRFCTLLCNAFLQVLRFCLLWKNLHNSYYDSICCDLKKTKTNFVNLPYYIGTAFVCAWLWNIKTSIQTIIIILLSSSSSLLLLLLLLHTNLCSFFIFLGIRSHNKRPGQRKSISTD